jgi:hypothetical protein
MRRGAERGKCEWGGEVRTGKLWSTFIERGGGEGAKAGSNGLHCHGRQPVLIAIKGGALIEMKQKRLMGGGGGRCFRAP